MFYIKCFSNKGAFSQVIFVTDICLFFTDAVNVKFKRTKNVSTLLKFPGKTRGEKIFTINKNEHEINFRCMRQCDMLDYKTFEVNQPSLHLLTHMIFFLFVPTSF